MSVKDLMRFSGIVSLRFFPPLTHLPHPGGDPNLLCRMCLNYSSCHCTGCPSLCPPAACESCSSGWPVPRHPLNAWTEEAGSAGDLRFLILCTSDLFPKVRVSHASSSSLFLRSCTHLSNHAVERRARERSWAFVSQTKIYPLGSVRASESQIMNLC